MSKKKVMIDSIIKDGKILYPPWTTVVVVFDVEDTSTAFGISKDDKDWFISQCDKDVDVKIDGFLLKEPRLTEDNGDSIIIDCENNFRVEDAEQDRRGESVYIGWDKSTDAKVSLDRPRGRLKCENVLSVGVAGEGKCFYVDHMDKEDANRVSIQIELKATDAQSVVFELPKGITHDEFDQMSKKAQEKCQSIDSWINTVREDVFMRVHAYPLIKYRKKNYGTGELELLVVEPGDVFNKS